METIATPPITAIATATPAIGRTSPVFGELLEVVDVVVLVVEPLEDLEVVVALAAPVVVSPAVVV